MHDFMIGETECSAQAQELLDKMYTSATNPDIYFLHRMYNSVLLAGGCIAGRILGAPKAKEYWLVAEKELDAPLQLDWKALTIGSPYEKMQRAMNQLVAAAQNTQLEYHARVMHLDVLQGMIIIAEAAGMQEVSDYNRLVWERLDM